MWVASSLGLQRWFTRVGIFSRPTAGLTRVWGFLSLGCSCQPDFLFAAFLDYLSLWLSSLTLDPFWVQGIHFPPFSLPHVAIVQCLDTESWRGSFSAAHHSIFLEVLLFKICIINIIKVVIGIVLNL